MLVFVHFYQIAKNLTTYESMRTEQVSPLLSAVSAGTMSLDGAQVTAAGAGHHGHNHKEQEGFLARWSKILGLDTFFAIAFQGYKGHQDKKHRHPKKANPFTRGILRNCQDFWMDGPVFGRKVSNQGLLGGQVVDYGNMYEVPRGGMSYRGYEEVATADDEV